MRARQRFPVLLLVAALLLLSACGGNANAPMKEDLDAVSKNVVAAGPISDKLIELCDWQIQSSEEYWDSYDKAIKNGTEPPESGDDYDEIKARYGDLLAEIGTLKTLAAFKAQTEAGKAPAFDNTLKAYQMYIDDISRSAEDMRLVFDYYFAMHDALKPIDEYEAAENTTGLNDYALMAGQLSQVISETQSALKKVECPAFMKSTHDAIVMRIDEFQSFSQDFSIAVQLSDPLRLASCSYRANRLGIQINQASRNLDEDYNLQFRQVKDRLNGRAATTKTELLSNITALEKALG